MSRIHFWKIWRSEERKSELKYTCNLVINLVDEKSIFLGILEHSCNTFFHNIPEGLEKKAEVFLIDYVHENHTDCNRMNIVVDITKHSMH